MKLIALVDNSSYALSVCDHAAWIAGKIASGVEVVHVLDGHHPTHEAENLSGSIGPGARSELLEELVELDARRAKLAHKIGRAILEDAKTRLRAADITDITGKLRNGDVVDAIADFEGEAELVVIGKRGEASDFDRLLPGSNLEHLIRSCEKPVLVASREFKPIKRFLIAFDGGVSVSKAIDYLSINTSFSDIECELLSVTSKKSDIGSKMEKAAQKMRDAGYSVTTKIESGQPETVIAREVESDGYDLLIMGAFGHSRIRNLIVGSTTTEMISACKIPILMLR